jgi:hypothetical protein
MRKLYRMIGVVVVAAGLFALVGIADAAPTRKPPKSCLRALSAAEEVFNNTIQYSKTTSDILTRASTALRDAGNAASANDAVAYIETRNRDVATLEGQLSVLVDRYNAASTQCRAGH